jgi:hypothetical protein
MQIKLTKGFFAEVDAEDFEWLNQWNWSSEKHGDHKRAVRWTQDGHGKRIRIHMHRIIMGCPENMQIDHIDRNPLNNKKSNLRICTQAENVMNRPRFKTTKGPYKGAYMHKECNKWVGAIGHKGKMIYLGLFSTAEEAAHAYDKKAKELHGEFACLNFPLQSDPCLGSAGNFRPIEHSGRQE